jgi:hypothetical protein
MRRIRYQVATSLDGYIAGPKGEADWIIMDPDTAQINSASFGRDDGASWSSGDELEGAARRSGAARHAG